MRVTIIGLNYAPEVTGIAPYTTGLAEGLAERGHDVSVITGVPHYPEWKVWEGYTGVAPDEESIEGVSVRRIKHFVPAEPTTARRVRMEMSFGRAAAMADWRDPDVVLALSPALLASSLVVGMAKRRKVPVGVIVQDIYSKGVVETGAMGGKGAAAARQLEVSTLRGAAGVAVIHDRFATALVDLGVHPSKLTVIRNWTHIRQEVDTHDMALTRRSHGWQQDETVILHAGNMGVKQGLENVIASAKLADSALTEDRKVKFVLLGDGNQRRLLQGMASGVRSLQFIETLPEQQFFSTLTAADILLINERPGVGEMAVPSKLTSYLVSGRPIIAATDGSSGTAHEIKASGSGVVVAPGKPQELLDAIAKVRDDPRGCSRMATAARSFAYRELDRDSAIDKYEKWCVQLMSQDHRARAG